MRPRWKSRKSGQALIMVTVSLLAMSGLIGMAVDFGWSYFVRRTEQSAADAAALAAANAALDAIMSGQTSYATLAGNATPQSCATGFANNLQSACLYAQQNGFTASQVQVSGDTTSPHPAGVNARYWVTVQISNTIPQLYSALLGNPNATVSAKATAAIVNTVVNASLVALNRANDPQPPSGWWQTSPATYNPDFMAGSGVEVGSINPANIHPGTGFVFSTTDQGSGYNQSLFPPGVPSTLTRGSLQGTWNASTASQNLGDGFQFYDPFHGLGQPPLSNSALNNYVAVPNGNLDAVCSTTCAPGVYYATAGGVPSGAQLTTSGNLTFANAANTFADYVFYGGLSVSGTAAFGPGRYVMAGILSGGTTNSVFNIASTASVTGGVLLAGQETDPGRLFILTDANYPGLQQVAPVPAGLQAANLTFGQALIAGSSVGLQGLNSASAQPLPSDTNSQASTLTDFGPLLIWQDQRFSNVKYTAAGNIDVSCGSIESPCTNSGLPTNPQLSFGNHVTMNGVVYQPRGAWTQLQNATNMRGPLILISGVFDIGKNTQVNPDGLPIPRALSVRRVALVE